MVPLERIEEELHAILQTSERICAVTCVPDEARGERLVVLHVQYDGLQVRDVVPGTGQSGSAQSLAAGGAGFSSRPELPLLGSGKVNLKRVKELAMELARRS